MVFTALLIPAAAFVLQTTACDTGDAPRERGESGSVAETLARPGGANGAVTITRDPENGSLQLAAAAPYAGEWTFDDVTASITERAQAGNTVKTLTVESHMVPPNEHFKLRLSHGESDIDAGTYSIDGAADGRTLDVSWEHGDKRFRSLSPAKGSVTVTSISEDRISGTYDITLPSMAEGEPAANLTGKFDAKIQR
jgi:hypothetical protein